MGVDKKGWKILACLAIVACSVAVTSCDSLKRFLARDLEEEDFSLGELYVDEYVKEVPYVPTPSEEAVREGRVNALGIEREPGNAL